MKLRGALMRVVAVVAALAPVAARAQAPAAAATAKQTIAVFHLKGPVSESPGDGGFPFSTEQSVSLKDLVARIAKARDDEAVKALVLLLEGSEVSIAQAEELRQTMAKFRESGKELFAHADALSMGNYALVAGASQVNVVPTADIWLTGIYAESPYLKGLLTKIGVEPDFLTCGEFKTAAEIFMRDGPSPQADEMQNRLLDGLYETHVKLIADGRGVQPDQVRRWIDGGPYTAAKAGELGIVDSLHHVREFEASLKERFGSEVKFDHDYGKKAPPRIDLSSPFGALNFWSELLAGKKQKVYKNSVAIVYVQGPIVLGSTQASPFASAAASSSDVRAALDKAADDDSIKAVVLRVNSPGGSAVASEIILDATRRVKAAKPLVVSMGDVAASGGYYVACGADTVFADESTITGSIGVVGGKLATSGLWNKLGVNWKGYGRGANASLLSTAQPFTPAQREHMQAWMDEIYGVFKGHVTAIRGDRLKKDIDSLAGGRVYTGRQALDLGLVDKLGTLDDAIQFAAAEAKVTDYDVRIVPEPKNFLERLLEDAAGQKKDDSHLAIAQALTGSGRRPGLLEAALPYFDKLDPKRLAAVRLALGRLELLHEEGALLMMPEILVQGR
ncbi:MAG: signal peptide peptidase SppA [Pirellulales bacterium]